MSRNDYDDFDQDTPPARRVTVDEARGMTGAPPSTWVAASPARAEIVPAHWTQNAPVVRVGEVLPPVQVSEIPAPLGADLRGDYTDRGRGFLLTTTPLAAVGGLLGVIAGVALAGAPLLSLAALAWFWGVFALTWLAAFAIHTVTGPDGVSLTHVLKAWGHVRAEREFRHKMIERAYEDSRHVSDHD